MTVTLTRSNGWGLPSVNGSSVTLETSLPLQEEAPEAQALRPQWINLETSSGVSKSAGTIQTTLDQLARVVRSWVEVARPEPVEIEHEVFVLMPPRSERTVDLRVKHAGRAIPLIHLEDLDTDS